MGTTLLLGMDNIDDIAAQFLIRKREEEREMEKVLTSYINLRATAARAVVGVTKRRMEREGDARTSAWGGRKRSDKNYRRGDSEWVEKYISVEGRQPVFPSEVFRRRISIPCTP